jgi:hypothetical protein
MQRKERKEGSEHDVISFSGPVAEEAGPNRIGQSMARFFFFDK